MSSGPYATQLTYFGVPRVTRVPLRERNKNVIKYGRALLKTLLSHAALSSTTTTFSALYVVYYYQSDSDRVRAQIHSAPPKN